MNNTNIFEAASKNKYRYPYKGMITTEDLCYLNLGQLDAVYKALSKELKACQDCAFSHWCRCKPDRDDYSDFEKCEEGRKRWLKQSVEEE